ncbi:MAG: FtsQ-type POTRA domain-containing protein, partial [Alphaproteobacteria bacterium]|nr:FtsQ-type POTRA domain-containing protein [Alphaproteobacteria bacterium]
MKKGTRRADVKGRLTPRRLSWLGWFFGRMLHYAKMGAGIAVFVGVIMWIWAQGYLVKVGDYAQEKVAGAAASAGMVVSDVIIEGRSRIDTETLKSAIGVERGTPTLAVDITGIHARLTGISWVKDVQVRRVLPDRIVVSLTERLPIAIWADAVGGPAVIDDEGVVLTHEDIADFGPLLAVEGKGSEKEAG